jgi:vitamin B12 transporter
MKKNVLVRKAGRVLTFKKFGRKGFSIFQSLNRVVKIGSLSVAYLLFAIPSNAERNMLIAGHDTLNAIRDVAVDEVIVSAQRVPVAISQVARVVKVIGKEELQSAPVQSLQDLLRYALDVDVRQRGNLGVQTDLSIRGGSFDQVLILLNGININDPQTGHHSLNLPVSFDAIDKIEILEGPAARIYGPNAFSGAINIITGTDARSNLKVQLSKGQNNYHDLGASATIVSGKVKNFFSVDNRASDGYIKNTDFNLTDAFYQGSVKTKIGDLNWQLGNSSRGFGANSFYTPAYPDQYEQVKTTFASVKLETNTKIHFIPSIYWRRNQDHFELFRYPELIPSWYKTDNYHLTDVYGANLNAWFATSFGKTAFGADFRQEDILSNVLGTPLGTPINVPGESGHTFNKSDERKNISLFAEHSITFNKIRISAGAMANSNTQLGSSWSLFPGADLSYSITNQYKWYSSVNSSLRMPTFTDLYYSSATNIGNASLKPEKAFEAEAGFKYQFEGIEGHLSYFHRDGTDIIDWVKRPSDNVWYAENITSLKTDGLEFSAKINPSKLLNHKIFIHSVNFSMSILNQGKQSGIYSSKYVLDYLKNKINLGLTHKIARNLTANWQFSYQDRNGTYTYWDGSRYGAETAYKPFVLVDTRIQYQPKRTTYYLEAANLLDQKYTDFGNVSEPGRWIKFGVIRKFNL